MTTRYLSVVELKDYVRSELVVDDALYEAAINTAEMSIDNALGRKMVVVDPAVSTARSFRPSESTSLYVPTGSDVLYIHDAAVIISVVDNGATLVSGTDYQGEPLNGLSAAGEAWPYYRLRRLGACWYQLPSAAAAVTVTARWGWAAIPPQVKESCKIIAKDVFQQRDVRFGLVAVNEAGGIGTRENRVVRDMVQKYGHPNSIGIG